jgi:polysaccharide export outer membrane protein
MLGFTSCYTTKKSVYFTDLPDSTVVKKIELAPFKEPLIQSDDILSITIQTVDPAVTITLNQLPSSTITSSSGLPILSGYLVSKNGDVELPIIGAVKVTGLTTVLASDLIMQTASKYFKEPTVQVRFANYKINVLGEVGHPGAYILPNEKVTIIDAISLAGDLTVYSRKENVLVVRDNNGHKEYARLNMNSSDVFKSPFFYLKQNDLIYIEANKAKISGANDTATVRNVTLAVSILTLISLLIVRFK